MSFPRSEHAPILSKVGELASVWNTLEQSIRYLLMFTLERQCPPTPLAQILTAHMGSVTLCEALRTAANEFTEGDLQARILHAVSYVEALRGYRNYYLHGFTHVGWRGRETGAEPIGFLQATSAKSRLVEHEETFDLAELSRIAEMFEEGRRFVGEIYSFSRDGDKPHWSQLHGALRDMPPLPPPLQKRRRFALETPL